MYNVVVTALICGIFGLMCLIFLKARSTYQMSIEHEKTIRFYLDRQLMTKIINKLIDSEPLEHFIADVTEYFALDKIIILKIQPHIRTTTPLDNEISSYIQDNMEAITEYLSHNKFVNIQRDNTKNTLLIQYLNIQKKYFVIYVINIENILIQNDIDLLTDAITPIIHLAHCRTRK